MTALAHLWAKTDQSRQEETPSWHPLLLHMLDVSACADAILAREPESTRIRMASVLGLDWESARQCLLLLIACHDLGKACPAFQCKWPKLLPSTGLKVPPGPNSSVKHGTLTQVALEESLTEEGWPEDLARLVADAVGSHHGMRSPPTDVYYAGGDRRAMGGEDWSRARRDIVRRLTETFRTKSVPTKETLSGPDFMLLAGLTSFADWIGSNEEWFSYGTPEDCGDLTRWFDRRIERAREALDAIRWHERLPLASEPRTFQEVFDRFTPRPLQLAVEHCLSEIDGPAVIIVEAPMGEGKTEAAFFAHLEFQRRFGNRGLYVALPTKATGNAMFSRTLKFIENQAAGRTLDLQLVHGATLMHESFQELRISNVHDSTGQGEVRAAEWFTQKKRALLSEYGVGTVDQALLPILPVKHQFVRLWGLANRVVVFDEIHAYDAYTGTLLVSLLRWLRSLGSPVVLLSATLPPSIRGRFLEAVGAELPGREAEYPRLTVLTENGEVIQEHFRTDPDRRLTVSVEGVPTDHFEICSILQRELSGGGFGMALLNTVQRTQDLYRSFPGGEPLLRENQRVGKRLEDGTEIYLFHARFRADNRQQREEQALSVFGAEGPRTGRKILISTQVAEQSLDLDFDLILSDLAPIDLLLQRAGRLWRHRRGARSIPEPRLLVCGLTGDRPPSFGKPLWWDHVYREDLLLRTWSVCHDRLTINLPDEIDALVRAVYEGECEIPVAIRDRYDQAVLNAEGDAIARRTLANQAIIGFPDDESWDDPSRFTLYDEDEAGVHRTLLAQTRIGDDSVLAVPLYPRDNFKAGIVPPLDLAKEWFGRVLSLSRKRIVMNLRSGLVPKGWSRSPLLRNCFPLLLNEDGAWIDDPSVRMDEDIGLVYEAKEFE